MVLDELRCGHTTSVCGMDDFWRELILESVRQLCRELLRTGSPVALKLGSLCGSFPLFALFAMQTLCENLFENKPLHVSNLALWQINPSLTLLYPVHNLALSPSVGVVGFAEYVSTHSY